MWRAVLAVALAGCSFKGGAATGSSDGGSSDASPGDAASDALVHHACNDDANYTSIGAGTSTYRFVDLAVSWNQARSLCFSDEADLTTVPSQAVMDAMIERLVSQNIESTDCIFGTGPDVPCGWVGLFQKDNPQSADDGWFFVGSLGGDFAGDSPLWRPNEPEDGGGGETGNESCAALSTDTNPGLEDRRCSDELPVICECAPG